MERLPVTGLEAPVYRQVFERLRSAILEGHFAADQRLPSTRELATRLGVSRNTVNTAYEMLLAEGYVRARQGSGFYVSRSLPDPVPQQARRGAATTDTRPKSATPARSIPDLSEPGRHLGAPSRPVPTTGAAFQSGLPALEHFPHRQWQQHVTRHAARPATEILTYRDDGGLPRLKSALSHYLRLARGVQCDESRIIIVTGGQAALDLAARMLVNPGDTVALEEPGYLGARDALRAAGGNITPTAVDDDGLVVKQLPTEARLVYVTPSYQFPLGVTMSAARRLALLQWAGERNAYVIEDDYDSEFRYRGRPLSSLQGLDTQDRVIYIGTFSKVMFPALRLGYLVVPEHLATAFRAALRKTGQDAPLPLQAAMADFIDAGQFGSHVRRMRALYGSRQRRFLELASEHLSSWLEVTATDAGMQLPAYFTAPMDESRLLEEGLKRDLSLGLLSRYYLGDCPRPGLFLGYSGVTEDAMAERVRALADAFACIASSC